MLGVTGPVSNFARDRIYQEELPVMSALSNIIPRVLNEERVPGVGCRGCRVSGVGCRVMALFGHCSGLVPGTVPGTVLAPACPSLVC